MRSAWPVLALLPPWAVALGCFCFSSKAWTPVQTIKGRVTPAWSLLGTCLLASLFVLGAPWIGSNMGGVSAHSRGLVRPATKAQADLTSGCLRIFVLLGLYGYVVQILWALR
ncbi:MAG: hypothetical protein D6731_02415 [Planctomycetota bacterium]|nr:MAG: hypothetical protein D6731_02415 [Planctomycetota bacterium]